MRKFKNLKYVLPIILFGFLFVGCSSDDDKSPGEINLVGKWLWESIEGDDADEFDHCSVLNYYIFNNDGSVVVGIYYDDYDSGECESETFISQYELVDGNRIKFFDSDGVDYVRIESYTGNRMVLIDEEYPDEFKLTLIRE